MCVCVSWKWCLALCADEAGELAVRVRPCRCVFADGVTLPLRWWWCMPSVWSRCVCVCVPEEVGGEAVSIYMVTSRAQQQVELSPAHPPSHHHRRARNYPWKWGGFEDDRRSWSCCGGNVLQCEVLDQVNYTRVRACARA